MIVKVLLKEGRVWRVGVEVINKKKLMSIWIILKKVERVAINK
jgi:hypothetical protein